MIKFQRKLTDEEIKKERNYDLLVAILSNLNRVQQSLEARNLYGSSREIFKLTVLLDKEILKIQNERIQNTNLW